ncbi:MAG: hypothetical protein AAFQ58_21405 [Pseudomonadota bacterium]
MKDNVKLTSLTVAIFIGSCIAATAETMSSDRIQAELVGQDLQGRMGILRASLRYNTDGTIEMRAPVGRGAGTWEMTANGMCVDITSGPRQGQECLTFTDNGDGSYSVSNGMTLVRR